MGLNQNTSSSQREHPLHYVVLQWERCDGNTRKMKNALVSDKVHTFKRGRRWAHSRKESHTIHYMMVNNTDFSRNIKRIPYITGNAINLHLPDRQQMKTFGCYYDFRITGVLNTAFKCNLKGLCFVLKKFERDLIHLCSAEKLKSKQPCYAVLHQPALTLFSSRQQVSPTGVRSSFQKGVAIFH